jgi:hypothetical protein
MTSLLLSALLALAAGAEPAAEPWEWRPTPIPEEEPPSPAPAPPAPPATPPVPLRAPPAEEPAAAPETWFDEGHAYVAEQLLLAVDRLDRFFGDNRQVALTRNASWIRWRNDLKVDDAGRFSFTTSLGAELRIPSIDERLERLRITVTGGTTDALDRLLPADPATQDATSRASAGLKLFLFDYVLTHADVSAGMLLTIPVGWYTRLRVRHDQPLGSLLIARLAVAGFWQTPTGWGTREDLDFERKLAPRLLLRLSNSTTLTEVSRGWEWASELGLFTVFGQRTAAFLGGGPSGATALGPTVEIWRVHARVRRDVLRRWLFLEVEPGVQFTRPPGGGRVRERYVIFRLEVQFDAAAAQPGTAGPSSLPAGSPVP